MVSLLERTTYMAGCTDPDYSDSSCPHKDNSGQQLLGLVQCSDSQVDGTALWSACPGPTTKTALGAPSQCSCSGTAAGLLWMTTSLSALAVLPTAIEETIQFADGAYPTVTSSETAGPTSSTHTSITNGSSSATPPPTAAVASTTGGLSTGAEVGIGIGAALMGLCAAGLAIFGILVFRRRSCSSRRKGKKTSFSVVENDMGLDATYGGEPSHMIHHPFASPGSVSVGRTSSVVAPDSEFYDNAYTGYKFELAADPHHSCRAELPADDISPTPMSVTPSSTPRSHGRIATLVSPVSPGTGWRSSSRPDSEMSVSAPSRSQAAAGGWDGMQERVSGGFGNGSLEVISEMHG